MITHNKTLENVYRAKDHEELTGAYKDWASNYDKDTAKGYGYTAHIVSAQALHQALGKTDGLILDAGCGTGLVGQELNRQGHLRIHALDFSKEMLDRARQKKVYRKHIHANLSKRLDLPDNQYNAVVCCGTFTYGHVKADAFAELIRVTKTSGIICFTIREGAYEEYGYRDKMIQLEQEKAWELLEMQDVQYFEQDNVQCKLCIYKIMD